MEENIANEYKELELKIQNEYDVIQTLQKKEFPQKKKIKKQNKNKSFFKYFIKQFQKKVSKQYNNSKNL